MKTKIITLSENDEALETKLSDAAKVIQSGGLVVFPTETVYGLGADATNPKAAEAIFAAKGRPADNPLIIHIANPEDAEKYTYTNETYYKLASRFMPGPLTVVLKAREIIPAQTRASLPTVAVRCPSNMIAHALIKVSDTAVAAPSANLSGTPSPTNAAHVIDDMDGRVNVIIDGGACSFGLESTIVKINDDGSLVLLRPGEITLADLLSVVEKVTVADAVTDKLKEGEVALSPGMKYRHYAPTAPLELIDGEVNSAIKYIENDGIQNIALICYDEDFEFLSRKFPNAHCYSFGKRGDEKAQAHLLFSILRDADKENFDKIYAPLPSTNGVGLALYNRMIRAAAHKIVKL